MRQCKSSVAEHECRHALTRIQAQLPSIWKSLEGRWGILPTVAGLSAAILSVIVVFSGSRSASVDPAILWLFVIGLLLPPISLFAYLWEFRDLGRTALDMLGRIAEEEDCDKAREIYVNALTKEARANPLRVNYPEFMAAILFVVHVVLIVLILRGRVF